MSSLQATSNRERVVQVLNGWMMLALVLAILVVDTAIVIARVRSGPAILFLILSLVCTAVFLLPGFFSLQPNEARVLILFGAYKGTVRESGLHWGNPFYSNGHISLITQLTQSSKSGQGQGERQRSLGRNKISLRARTFNGERLKVNDRRGSPIEIAAVVVWRVQDTAQAVFDVDNYEHYVTTQSESAVRHLASRYPYDGGTEDEISLRSNVEEVSQALLVELEQRLAKAGVAVDETRLTHLAYAPEIAQAMLRRQQAEAIIAAREKIVHGAVSMVDMALRDLAAKDVVHLDDERRAAMVSNLMVVLCGESEVHPIVNAGTLYT
ncbi:MAG TPA: SPFH domain-containing protein [Terriglobia bacterium]|nr:SPFH domain-containing protein [Terriglobia bacterium]